MREKAHAERKRPSGGHHQKRAFVKNDDKDKKAKAEKFFNSKKMGKTPVDNSSSSKSEKGPNNIASGKSTNRKLVVTDDTLAKDVDDAAPGLDIDRVKQVQLNQKISQHASRKELQQAKTLYEEALNEDIANSHTFAAMVNAAVRCGEMSTAESVISTMLSKGRKLKDIVLYTTLMKGYCAQGNLFKALTLYQDLLKKKVVVQPNIRTINTLLRGCVQTGETYIAEALVQQMQRDWKIKPDASSWEYLVTLLSQSLLLDKIPPIVGRVKADAELHSALPSLLLQLSRAATLGGDFKLARKSLAQASAAIEEQARLAAEQKSVASNGNDDDEDVNVDPLAVSSGLVANKDKSVTGGKRAWKSKGDSTLSTDDRRNESLQLYREHIREEWKQDIQLLNAFIDQRQTQLSSGEVTSNSNPQQQALDFLIPYLPRMFSFDSNKSYPAMDSTASIFASEGSYPDVDAKTVRQQLFAAICYKFGFDAMVKKSTGFGVADLLAANEKVKDSGTQSGAAGPVSLADMINRMVAATPSQTRAVDESALSSIGFAHVKDVLERVERSLDERGQLRFDHIFGSKNPRSQKSGKQRLLKMEICSGAGEWVVTQAKNDPENDWVALELRHDRVYQTITKMLLAQTRNLCVLGGDALLVMPRHISAGSVQQLFVNHPEPPQQTGGDHSQAQHLLNEHFFLEAQRILVDGGQCTIVTDNLWYGKFLCRLLSGMHTLQLRSLTSNQKSVDKDWVQQFDVDDIVLWTGEPGQRAGHVVEASSYFDRLWKRGQLQERYFIVLVKNAHYQPRKAAKQTIKIEMGVNSSKKITFSDDSEEQPTETLEKKTQVHAQQEKGKKNHATDSGASHQQDTLESIVQQIQKLEQSGRPPASTQQKQFDKKRAGQQIQNKKQLNKNTNNNTNSDGPKLKKKRF